MDSKPEGLDGEFARKVIKLMSAVNVRVYRLTRGRIGGTWRVGAGWKDPVPICLLEHRGRKTGKLRTSPLVYLRDGERVVVVASQAGRPHHPLWYRNIEADPQVTVQIRGTGSRCGRTPRTPTSVPGCGRGWSTSTATTTPTSRGPTGDPRRGPGPQVVGKFRTARHDSATGRRALDGGARRTKLGSGRFTERAFHVLT